MSLSEPETRFVWPPRQGGETEGNDPVPEPTGGGPHPGQPRPSPWRQLESILLGGPAGRPLEGWSPDPPDAGCRRCGGVVGLGEADETGCASCRGIRLEWSRAVRLGVYDGPLRGAIVACKYQRDRAAGIALGAVLAKRVSQVFEREGVDASGLLLVPVPTTTRRRLDNGGIDHSLILAREIGRAIGVRPTRLLERRHRPHQAGLSSEARARNIAGTIRLRSGRPVPSPAEIVLVDDVRTTGATATACFRAMRAGKRRRGEQAPTNKGSPRLWLVTAAVSSKRSASRSVGGERVRAESENSGQKPRERT